MNYIVTNEEKFSKIKSLELYGSLNKGEVIITPYEWVAGEEVEQFGQFGPHDFEEEWGFVLTSS